MTDTEKIAWLTRALIDATGTSEAEIERCMASPVYMPVVNRRQGAMWEAVWDAERKARDIKLSVLYLDFMPDDYRCSHCGVHGVKLWRPAGDSSEKWCATCGTAQAGLPDNIDQFGRREGEYGWSDQIYSSNQGLNLVPCIVDPLLGGFWGYTSVPQPGVNWWHNLPTRQMSYG